MTTVAALQTRSPLTGYVEDCQLRNVRKETIRRYTGDIQAFFSFLVQRGTEANQADKEILKQYLAHLRARNLKQATLQNAFSALNSFYEYIMYEGRVAGDP